MGNLAVNVEHDNKTRNIEIPSVPHNALDIIKKKVLDNENWNLLEENHHIFVEFNGKLHQLDKTVFDDIKFVIKGEYRIHVEYGGEFRTVESVKLQSVESLKELMRTQFPLFEANFDIFFWSEGENEWFRIVNELPPPPKLQLRLYREIHIYLEFDDHYTFIKTKVNEYRELHQDIISELSIKEPNRCIFYYSRIEKDELDKIYLEEKELEEQEGNKNERESEKLRRTIKKIFENVNPNSYSECEPVLHFYESPCRIKIKRNFEIIHNETNTVVNLWDISNSKELTSKIRVFFSMYQPTCSVTYSYDGWQYGIEDDQNLFLANSLYVKFWFEFLKIEIVKEFSSNLNRNLIRIDNNENKIKNKKNINKQFIVKKVVSSEYLLENLYHLLYIPKHFYSFEFQNRSNLPEILSRKTNLKQFNSGNIFEIRVRLYSSNTYLEPSIQKKTHKNKNKINTSRRNKQEYLRAIQKRTKINNFFYGNDPRVNGLKYLFLFDFYESRIGDDDGGERVIIQRFPIRFYESLDSFYRHFWNSKLRSDVLVKVIGVVKRTTSCYIIYEDFPIRYSLQFHMKDDNGMFQLRKNLPLEDYNSIIMNILMGVCDLHKGLKRVHGFICPDFFFFSESKGWKMLYFPINLLDTLQQQYEKQFIIGGHSSSSIIINNIINDKTKATTITTTTTNKKRKRKNSGLNLILMRNKKKKQFQSIYDCGKKVETNIFDICPNYLPPEKLSSQILSTPSSDIYSLGFLFYEIWCMNNNNNNNNTPFNKKSWDLFQKTYLGKNQSSVVIVVHGEKKKKKKMIYYKQNKGNNLNSNKKHFINIGKEYLKFIHIHQLRPQKMSGKYQSLITENCWNNNPKKRLTLIKIIDLLINLEKEMIHKSLNITNNNNQQQQQQQQPDSFKFLKWMIQKEDQNFQIIDSDFSSSYSQKKRNNKKRLTKTRKISFSKSFQLILSPSLCSSSSTTTRRREEQHLEIDSSKLLSRNIQSSLLIYCQSLKKIVFKNHYYFDLFLSKGISLNHSIEKLIFIYSPEKQKQKQLQQQQQQSLSSITCRDFSTTKFCEFVLFKGWKRNILLGGRLKSIIIKIKSSTTTTTTTTNSEENSTPRSSNIFVSNKSKKNKKKEEEENEGEESSFEQQKQEEEEEEEEEESSSTVNNDDDDDDDQEEGRITTTTSSDSLKKEKYEDFKLWFEELMDINKLFPSLSNWMNLIVNKPKSNSPSYTLILKNDYSYSYSSSSSSNQSSSSPSYQQRSRRTGSFFIINNNSGDDDEISNQKIVEFIIISSLFYLCDARDFLSLMSLNTHFFRKLRLSKFPSDLDIIFHASTLPSQPKYFVKKLDWRGEIYYFPKNSNINIKKKRNNRKKQEENSSSSSSSSTAAVCVLKEIRRIFPNLRSISISRIKTSNQITDFEIRYLSGISSVILNNNRSLSSKGLTFLGKKIRELRINGNPNISDETLRSLCEIRVLHARGENKITDKGMLYLSNSIRELVLGTNSQISPRVFPKLKSLRILDLGASIHVSDSSLTHLRNLRVLRLDGNQQITNHGLKVLSLNTKRRLTELVIRGNESVDNVGIKSLVKCQTLEKLDIGFVKLITNEGLRYIGLSVKDLSIDGLTKITDVGISYLRGDLTRISFTGRNDEVTDLSLKCIKRARFINFSGKSKITDIGLSYLSNIRELRIGNCPGITDLGIKMLPKSKLKILDISGNNQLSNDSLETLKDLEVLEFLDISSNNRIDNEGIKFVGKIVRNIWISNNDKVNDEGIYLAFKDSNINFVSINSCKNVSKEALGVLNVDYQFS